MKGAREGHEIRAINPLMTPLSAAAMQTFEDGVEGFNMVPISQLD